MWIKMILSVVCMMAAASVATAATFDYLDASSVNVAFNPGRVVVDVNGAWIVGNGVARYGIDGTLQWGPLPYTPPMTDPLVVETGDGGLILADYGIPNTPFLPPCNLIKLTASAAVQWTSQLPNGLVCWDLHVDHNGTIWALSPVVNLPEAVLTRIDIDGSSRQIPLPDALDLHAIEVPASGVGVVGAGYVIGASRDAASIVAVAGDGTIAWQWKDDSANQIMLIDITIGKDGNIVSGGYISGQTSLNRALVGLTASGSLRWEKVYPTLTGALNSGLASDTDGDTYLSFTSGETFVTTLVKFDAQGNPLWVKALPQDPTTGAGRNTVNQNAGVAAAPNGDVLALGTVATSSTTAFTNLYRFDPDGNPLATTTLAGAPNAASIRVLTLLTLPDSSALVTTGSAFAGNGLGALVPGSVSGVLMHIGRDGQASAPFQSATVIDNGTLIASFVADDGTTYLLTNYTVGQKTSPQDNIIAALEDRYALSRVSPNGSRVWKTIADGHWNVPQVHATAGRVCIVGTYAAIFQPVGSLSGDAQPDQRVECYASGSGAKLFTTVMEPPTGTALPPLGSIVLADGSIVAADNASDSNGQFFTVAANGTAAAPKTLSVNGAVVGFAADGTALVDSANGQPDVATLDVNGNARYQTHLDAQTILTAQILDDDTVVAVVVGNDNALACLKLTAAGGVAWSTAVTAAGNAQRVSVAVDSDSVYVALTATSNTNVVRLSRSGGAIAWQSTTELAGNGSHLLTDPATARLVQVAIYDHKLGTAVIDKGTGAATTPTFSTCGSSDCSVAALADGSVGTDGTLRLVLSPTTGATLYTPQILAFDAIGAPTSAVPVGQAGISGAWFAPYEGGQGFVIDYISGNQTVFIPWFTFSLDGGNEPSALAWYTFQGTAAPSATGADLVIAIPQPGVFNSGTVGAQVVGSGHVSFSDCDHGTLSYAFNADVNNGAQGTMTILRLGPEFAACQPGSANATIATPPAANGFDVNQSGSWFNTDTGGQGIEFTIVPAGSGSPGFIYGAWFTFDPSGAGDDPNQQYWFTVQADLSSAANGRVTAPIYNAFGGSLDSAPTSNVQRVGQAVITLSSCTEATMDYIFDDTPPAHAFRALSGSMHLTKIGGCSAFQ